MTKITYWSKDSSAASYVSTAGSLNSYVNTWTRFFIMFSILRYLLCALMLIWIKSTQPKSNEATGNPVFGKVFKHRKLHPYNG